MMDEEGIAFCYASSHVGRTLKNLCITRIAAHLWNLRQDQVDDMHFYFRHPRVKSENEMWNQLTREVIKPLQSVNLPPELYNDIVYSVYLMKERRIDWYNHLQSAISFYDMPKEKFLELCLKKIHWTHCCTVYEEKSIRSCYFDPILEIDSYWWKLFIFCSQYCSELSVQEMMMNMQIWTDSKSVRGINFYESYECHLALYWYQWYFRKNLGDLIRNIRRNNGDPLNFYDENQSVEENMFKLALHCSLKKGVIYFWTRVSKMKRDAIILDYFNNPLTDKLFKHLYLKNIYRNKQKCEIQLLIWMNVSENMKKLIAATKDFKDDQSVIYYLFQSIGHWPVDLIILQIISMTKYLAATLYRNFCGIITYENQKIYSEDLKLPVKDNKFQRIFNQSWKIVPLNYKQVIAEIVVEYLYKSWDVPNLIMILNDKDLGHMRQTLIMKGLYKFVKFAEENNKKMVQEFFCELLVPESLTKDSKEMLKALYEHVTEGKFDTTKWTQKSGKVRDFKEHVNEKFICYYFVKCYKFDLADKFLMWKLGKAELVKSFKANFYADKFSVDHIFQLWDLNKRNTRNAEIQCNKFLDWFLGDGKKERFFVQEKIAKGIIAAPYILENRFIEKENFDMIDDFLIWIIMTRKQISACKNKIFERSSLRTLLEGYVVENKIEIARKALNCAFDTEEKKNNFLREFFEKKAGIRGVKNFLSDFGTFDVFEPKPSLEEIKKKMKEFINFWFKPLENFDRLKRELERWPELCRKEIDPTTDSAELNEIYLEGVDEEPDRHDYYYSYDAYLKAYYDWMDEAAIYFSFCDERNLKIFMKLLRCFEANRGEFCC